MELLPASRELTMYYAVMRGQIIVLLTAVKARAEKTAKEVAGMDGAVYDEQYHAYYRPDAKIGDMSVVFIQDVRPEQYRYEGELTQPDAGE